MQHQPFAKKSKFIAKRRQAPFVGVSMKKFSLGKPFMALAMLALVLALGLAFVGCGNGSGTTDDTDGGTASTFTMTNIPSQFNGMTATVHANGVSSGNIMGYQSYDGRSATGVPISNGRVSIPLYRSNTGIVYTYTEAASYVIVTIDNGNPFTRDVVIRFDNVPFRNGSATKSWDDGALQ